MLTSTLRTILERAASDAAFRESLLSNPDSALTDYKLAADEMAALRQLSREQLIQLVADMQSLEGELTDDLLENVAGGGYTRYNGTCTCPVAG